MKLYWHWFLISFDICDSQLWRNGVKGRWRGPDKDNWRKMEQPPLKLEYTYIPYNMK